MRLFVAVDVDRATREAAVRLRQRLTRAHPALDRGLRWVQPDQLHLTLRFIGEREDAQGVEHVLGAPIDRPCFSIRWGVPAWLPPSGRPRVFYVPVTEGAPLLRALAAEVSDRLTATGLPAEERPFTAHLTLARVRDGADPGLARLVDESVAAAPFAPDVVVGVPDIALYESRLSSRGPSYSVRLRSRLA